MQCVRSDVFVSHFIGLFYSNLNFMDHIKTTKDFMAKQMMILT